MIVIKHIQYCGGACPYQLEAITEDGKYLYIRYRGGMLRYGVWDDKSKFDLKYKEAFQIGDKYDGYPNHEKFMEKLAPHITFPEGFMFEFNSFNGMSQDELNHRYEDCHSQSEQELKKYFGQSSNQ